MLATQEKSIALSRDTLWKYKVVLQTEGSTPPPVPVPAPAPAPAPGDT